MARTWGELLGDERRPDGDSGGGAAAGLFSRLRDSLGRSRRALTQQLAAAAFDPGDTASWERLEEALIAGDVGVPATAELVGRLEARGDARRPERGARGRGRDAASASPPRVDLAGEPT